MSSIITTVLNSSVGLLLNKARDMTAAKLKDGDVTDVHIRELIVEEMSDIKNKLNALLHQNLNTSCLHLKDGVAKLNACLDKSNDEKMALLNEDSHRESSGMPSIAENGILGEVLELSHAMGKVIVDSDEMFEAAKQQFKEARLEACKAYANDGLDIQDKILAAKLRIVSEILERLESPEIAITGCMSFLRELHSLSAVREMFSVYLDRRMNWKSMLHKAERAENIKSIMLINYVVFQFVSKFSINCSTLAWPTIEVADRSFNPIKDWQEISTRRSWGKELVEPPTNRLLLDKETLNCSSAVMNSHGEILVSKRGGCIKVVSRRGDIKVVELPDSREGEVIQKTVVTFTVDVNDNVFVILWLKMRTEDRQEARYLLHVLDENYNVKHEHKLDFLEVGRMWRSLSIAVSKRNDIILSQFGHPNVYVCDNNGQKKYTFKTDFICGRHDSLSISGRDEIMVVGDRYYVRIYTMKGELKFETTPLGEHRICDVAFHYIMQKIIVLTTISSKDHPYWLHCFSETGKLETSMFFCNESECNPQLTSHPGGPFAVVRERSITFL